MNKKKKILIPIMVIIIIMALIVVGLIAILKLGLLKSEKEMFFEYTSRVINLNNNEEISKAKQYIEKKQTTPYENNGKIDFGTEEFNVTFEGKVDNSNKKNEQSIKLNYSDDVNFPIKFKKIENIWSLHSEYVTKQPISIDVEKKEELSNLLGNNSINFDTIEEEVSNLKEIDYKNVEEFLNPIINEQFSDDQFEKVKEENRVGYKLNTNGEQVKTLIVTIIENVKNNEEIYNKFEEELKKNNPNANAEESLEDLKLSVEEIFEDYLETQIQITAYPNEIVFTADTITVSITKNIEEDEEKYILDIKYSDEDNQNLKVNLQANFKGFSQMENVEENYGINIEFDEYKYNYEFSNNVQFKENVDIEDFTETIELTKYSPEQVQKFMEAVKQQVEKVDAKQMQQLGVQENPIATYVLKPILKPFQDMRNEISNQAQNAKQEMQTQIETDQQRLNELQGELEQQEVAAFNSRYESYESENMPGSTLKQLINLVKNSNISDADRAVTISYNNKEYSSEANLNELATSIETSMNFKVKLEKNAEGYVKKIIIEKI